MHIRRVIIIRGESYLVGAGARHNTAQAVESRWSTPHVGARHHGRLVINIVDHRRFRAAFALVATVVGDPVFAPMTTASAHHRDAVIVELLLIRVRYC